MAKEEILHLSINGKRTDVHIIRKRIRNLYLRIEEDGSLQISCGPWVKQEEILRFLSEKAHWIEKNQTSVERKNVVNYEGLESGTIFWLGEAMQTRVIAGKRNFCWVENGIVTFELKGKSNEAAVKAFRAAGARTLKLLIEQRRGQWDEKICRASNLPLPEISIRYMTSRWGVCAPMKAHITMSTRLIHYPTGCLDYVLLHEYVHFLVPNHSERFYTLVRKYMPDYEQYNRLLK